jgi:hypothetical protein
VPSTRNSLVQARKALRHVISNFAQERQIISAIEEVDLKPREKRRRLEGDHGRESDRARECVESGCQALDL